MLNLILGAAYAQDTIHDGSTYGVGEYDRYNRKKGTWYFYNSSGSIYLEQTFKQNKIPKVRRSVSFNGSDKIISIQRGVLNRKTIYFENNQKIKLERYKGELAHGIWRNYATNSKSRYFCDSLYEQKQKRSPRTVFLFTYGMPAYDFDLEDAYDDFFCNWLPIAGCIVSRKIKRKAAWHNFWLNQYQLIRFGKNWKALY